MFSLSEKPMWLTLYPPHVVAVWETHVLQLWAAVEFVVTVMRRLGQVLHVRAHEHLT